MKVLNEQEILKQPRGLYTESYEVNYFLTIGGIAKPQSALYFTASKGRNEAVYKKWAKENRGNNVIFISVNYQ